LIHVSATSRVGIDLQLQQATDGEIAMMDIVMLATSLGFFALTVGYAFACDRL
jgi:hypothetical protein